MPHNKKALQQIKEIIKNNYSNNIEIMNELMLIMKDLKILKTLKLIIKANDLDDLWLTDDQIELIKQIKNN